jgi:hypothetical protein
VDEPQPIRFRLPHPGIIATLALVAVGWLLMLSTANIASEILRPFDGIWLAIPQFGLLSVLLLGAWASVGARPAVLYATGLILEIIVLVAMIYPYLQIAAGASLGALGSSMM